MANTAALSKKKNRPNDSRIRELEQQIQDSKRLRNWFEERLQFEKLLSEISSAYSSLPADDVDNHIINGLGRIGEFLDADRCTLAQFNESKTGLSFIHSWQRDSVPFMKTDRYLETRNVMPYSMDRIKRGEIFEFTKLEDLPDNATIDKKSYTLLSINSHVSVPIEVGGELMYNIAISSSQNRTWPKERIQRFRLAGEVFANALLRKKKELDIRNAFLEIKGLKDRLEADCTYLREEIELEHNAHNMIGQSEPLKHVLMKIHQIAPTDITVFIHGETGTGKELVARAIHDASLRKKRPMVKVNCAALPANLIESELFGHERGAFTSAEARQVGRFELADGNTLFLDEIGELPLESQAKLLRVLQDGEFERLGSSRTIKVDVRIIAATNRDLEEEVKKGRFRQDLWYRLNVFPISVPPLRKRHKDIPILANYFVNKIGRKLGKTIKRIPTTTINALEGYHWPGNVRELENAIERAVINTPGDSLQLVDTPLSPVTASTQATDIFSTLQEVEYDHIVNVLQATNGRVDGPKGAALILGMNPSTLRTRMRKLGIKRSIVVDLK